MIFTNCSWAGDYFLLLPIASYFYKKYNEKIHWIVSKNYYMYHLIEKVIRHQDFTEDYTLVDVGDNAWDSNCWVFNPNEKFGIKGDYLNFGFTNNLWGKYMPDFYASLYEGLGVDNDYKIKLIDFPDKIPYKKVTMEVAHQKGKLWEKWLSMMPQDVVQLNYKNQPFELNLWYSAKAEERYFGCSSSPVMMDLMDLPCVIYGESSLGDGKMYYRNKFHRIIHT